MLLNGRFLCGIISTMKQIKERIQYEKFHLQEKHLFCRLSYLFQKRGTQTRSQSEQKALQDLCRMTNFQKPIDKGF